MLPLAFSYKISIISVFIQYNMYIHMLHKPVAATLRTKTNFSSNLKLQSPSSPSQPWQVANYSLELYSIIYNINPLPTIVPATSWSTAASNCNFHNNYKRRQLPALHSYTSMHACVCVFVWPKQAVSSHNLLWPDV